MAAGDSKYCIVLDELHIIALKQRVSREYCPKVQIPGLQPHKKLQDFQAGAFTVKIKDGTVVSCKR